MSRLKVRELPRNVKVLSAVSLFQDAASEMLYPVMPIFITSVLGAPPAVVGLIEGVADATSAGMKVVAGRVADRRPKKPLIFAGYGMSALAKPLIGIATGWPLVLFARFFDRFGKGLRTPSRDAMIALDTPPNVRGAAFGFHRAADSAGAVIGPLLGLWLYHLLDKQLRLLFFVAFIPAALAVALIGFAREPHRPVGVPRSASSTPLTRSFYRVLLVTGAFGAVNFPDALVLIRAQHLGLSFTAVIAVYAVYQLTYSVLSFPAGRLSDRMSRGRVFGAGVVVFGVCYLGLGLAKDGSLVWVLLPLYGAFTALTDGVGKAWIADTLGESSIGRGLGLFHGVTGGMSLVAGLWAGAAWGSDGALPLVVSGVAALPIGVVLIIGARKIDMTSSRR